MTTRITRRALTEMLAANALFQILPGWCRAAARGTDRLRWETEPAAGVACQRTYRADAQVLLLSVPLIRRAGVGAGSVAWRESGTPDSAVRVIEFTGFSRPERAAGLNRLGWIREMTRFRDKDAAESLYFGLMTASPEESAAEARKALHSATGEAAYTAIDGRVDPQRIETCSAHFTAPAQLSMDHRQELMERARLALAGAQHQSCPNDAANRGSQPFLQTLAEALRSQGQSEAGYSFNGRTYRLCLRKYADSKATAHFRAQQLVPASAVVIRVEGKLSRAAGGKETDFRLWIEEGARQPLPLRIDYQPKSYLRLIFEAEA